jgi:hypothetical protein
LEYQISKYPKNLIACQVVEPNAGHCQLSWPQSLKILECFSQNCCWAWRHCDGITGDTSLQPHWLWPALWMPPNGTQDPCHFTHWTTCWL